MITCNWPDFTKRTAGTENSSLLSSQAIQFNFRLHTGIAGSSLPTAIPDPE